MEEGKNIELRSEEVREVLGTPPNWQAIREGNTGHFTGHCCFAGSLLVFKCPDIIGDKGLSLLF